MKRFYVQALAVMGLALTLPASAADFKHPNDKCPPGFHTVKVETAKSLEAAGLVQRHECAADRRGAFAGITDAGIDRLRRSRPTHLRGIEEHFVARLSDEDLATLRDALTKLIPMEDRSQAEPNGFYPLK